jgi:hypothetical protein
MQAGGAKASGAIKGKVKRNPDAAGKVGKAKAAAPSTKAKSPKFVTEQSGRVRRAALGGGRTAIVRANSATIINAKGEPIMTRKGLPNITAGKKWAANPNARGPRLMRNKFASEAAPSRDIARTSRPAGTIRKPRGTTKAAAKPAKAASKVDLSGAAFTARTRRAQSKLNAAQKDFSARGRSGSDTRFRKRVETLQSAVASLRTINSRAKRQGLPSSDIFKARAKRSTNPKLSPAEKAARTRQNKAAAKFQANVAAMERARRNR